MKPFLKKLTVFHNTIICLLILFIFAFVPVGAQNEESEAALEKCSQLLSQQQFREALSVLDEAIMNDENYAPLYLQRGVIYAMQGKLNLAIEEFDKGIELDPQSVGHRASTSKGRGAV